MRPISRNILVCFIKITIHHLTLVLTQAGPLLIKSSNTYWYLHVQVLFSYYFYSKFILSSHVTKINDLSLKKMTLSLLRIETVLDLGSLINLEPILKRLDYICMLCQVNRVNRKRRALWIWLEYYLKLVENELSFSCWSIFLGMEGGRNDIIVQFQAEALFFNYDLLLQWDQKLLSSFRYHKNSTWTTDFPQKLKSLSEP